MHTSSTVQRIYGKVKAAKNIVRIPTYPGMIHALVKKMGSVYDLAWEAGYEELYGLDPIIRRSKICLYRNRHAKAFTPLSGVG